jgi:uncharacterized membrane protein
MLKYAITYLGTGLAFAAMDAVYLTIAGQRVYRPTLDYALSDTLNLPAAIAFYLVYIAGIVALAIAPNRDATLRKVALTGAMLGAMAYATYDLTNQATLKAWTTQITLIDVAWGAFATAVAATAGVVVWRWSGSRFA